MLNMKQLLVAISLMLTLGLSAQNATGNVAKQKAVATAQQPDSIEAFSDTTAVDSAETAFEEQVKDEVTEEIINQMNTKSIMKEMMSGLDGDSLAGMLFVLAVLFILFVLSPVLVLFVLFYFIYKNRKERIRLAEKAMESGQAIPDNLLPEKVPTPDSVWQKGIRQLCLGVGLMVFLGYTAGEIGFGVGVLVACIGLGNILIAKRSRNNNNNNN